MDEREHAGVPRGLVAYFSMEIVLDEAIPTYAGGLGVLAGDTVRAAADLGVPMVAVSLVHRQGHFRQRLDRAGNQTEEPAPWEPERRCESLDTVVDVMIGGRAVAVRAWRWRVGGLRGHEVPVYLLDTDVEGNDAAARRLTDRLYGGDDRHRLAQEAVLGLGGVAFLRALGLGPVTTWHMNEGHSALLTLALLEDVLARRGASDPDAAALEEVRGRCVFTTHTPVPAGHDAFGPEIVRDVLGPERARLVAASGCCLDGTLNMTFMALQASRYVNGVAMRHRATSAGLYPGYPIGSITNGVHAITWTSPAIARLFDRHIPEWRRQNLNLRYACGIPLDELRDAHEQTKADLLHVIETRAGVRLRQEAFTIGFARRATEYKRAALLFTDTARLRRLASSGPLQLVFAGKAHPRDESGEEQIRAVVRAAAALADVLPVVYVEDYDVGLARRLCAGCDLWLNTPRRPLEASGTSGMKAALNGVPSLSVLDGWWLEGHVEGVTGWSIEDGDDPAREAGALYDKLEQRILPCYRDAGDAYTTVMRSTIALNGAFFNAERMVFQYAENAYGL